MVVLVLVWVAAAAAAEEEEDALPPSTAASFAPFALASKAASPEATAAAVRSILTFLAATAAFAVAILLLKFS